MALIGLILLIIIEGIKSIMVMLYGQYPSAALRKYADNIVTFSKQINNFQLSLPVLYEFVFNNFTSNLGIANAYNSIREELIDFCYDQYIDFPQFFVPVNNPLTTKKSWEGLFVTDVKDFHTSGKVSATLGIPLYELPNENTYTMPDEKVIQLPPRNYSRALQDVKNFVYKIT